jgi:two-component SAPR family response regulator
MGVEGVGIESSLSRELKDKALPVPRILLVDDDVIFGKIMLKIAQREQIPLTFYSSVKALGQLSHLQADVGLVDYDLGSITGIQLTDFLERYLQEIPIILISQYRHIGSKHWPNSVVDFVPKSVGSYGILNAAFRVHASRNHLEN